MDDLKTNDTAEPETLPFFYAFFLFSTLTLMSYLLIIFTDP